MIQAVFLLESSFVALTVDRGRHGARACSWPGTSSATRAQPPSWAGLEMVVPWADLVLIFVAVYAVALLATLAPAIRASRVAPAEALATSEAVSGTLAPPSTASTAPAPCRSAR